MVLADLFTITLKHPKQPEPLAKPEPLLQFVGRGEAVQKYIFDNH